MSNTAAQNLAPVHGNADGTTRHKSMLVMALDCLSRSKSGLTIDQVAREIGLSGDQVIEELSFDLDRMVTQGLVGCVRGNQLRMEPGLLLVCGQVKGHPAGHGFLVLDGEDEALYLNAEQMKRVMHGDEIWCVNKPGAGYRRPRTQIVAIAHRRIRKLAGRILWKRGACYAIAADPRINNRIQIPAVHAKEAGQGDVVSLELTSGLADCPYVGRVIEVIGDHDAAHVQSRIAICNHGIPDRWPEAAALQIQQMKDRCTEPKPGKDRMDIRSLPFVTIDGSDARDFDDAVYCRKTGKGWNLVVAIADVSDYVKSNDAVDQEAFERGTSVYFPGQVIPMLPEYLSNGICSLNPDEDRHCMVCEMELDDQAQTRGFRFYQAVMRSRFRLTYEQVNRIVVERAESLRKEHDPVCSSLDDLHAMALCRRNGRMGTGAIDFRIDEPYFDLGPDHLPVSISPRPRLPSHELIEECMLAANMCAAEFLHARFGDRGIYRNHAGPGEEDLIRLRHFLHSLGMVLEGGEEPGAKDYQRLLENVRSRSDIRDVVQTVLLRSLSKACYESRPIGHFALAIPLYTHFTSPIRRYGDLQTHRMIKHALQIPGYQDVVTSEDHLARIANQCSATELRADRAVQDVNAWLKAVFMQQRIGQAFSGSVTGVREFGVFVRIDRFLVDGLVHVSNLGSDYFFYEESLYQLIGERSGIVYQLGDKLEVEVLQVNLDEKKIDFVLSGSSASRVYKRPHGRHGRKKRRR